LSPLPLHSSYTVNNLRRDEDVKKQFDINVFGPLRVIRAVLPYLRPKVTEALAQEIAPFGLRALIVEPGYFRTNFLASASTGLNLAKPIREYDGTVAHEAAANFEKYNLKQPGNPVLGAAKIWEVVSGEGMAKRKKQMLKLLLGSDAGAVMKGLAEDAETAREYGGYLEEHGFQ
jgi:NAD(P)-dependent dehydrogenase (short-subunit alcohol dehydrogenase family)